MKCKNIQRLLPLYALKELDEAQISEIDLHLSECVSCRSEGEKYLLLINSLTHEMNDTLSPILKLQQENALYKRIIRENTRKNREINIVSKIIKVAAVIAVFLLGYFTEPFTNSSSLQQQPISSGNNDFLRADLLPTVLSGFRFTSDGLKLIAKGKSKVKLN